MRSIQTRRARPRWRLLTMVAVVAVSLQCDGGEDDEPEGEFSVVLWSAEALPADWSRLDLAFENSDRAGYRAAAAADVDGDGIDDLVRQRSSDPESAVLLVAFGPDFENAERPETRGVRAWDIGDVDGDGRQDLVVLFEDRMVWHTWETGHGWREMSSKPVDGAFDYLHLTDFDGDGLLDPLMVVDSYDSPDLFVMPTASATELGDQTHLVAEGFWASVGVADLDGDGIDDAYGRGSAVAFGSPTGEYEVLELSRPVLAAYDLNFDGLLDLFTVGSPIDVRINNGDRTFAEPEPLSPFGARLGGIWDIDEDGDPELVAIGPSDEIVILRRNAGGTDLDFVDTLAVPGDSGGDGAVLAGDFDGDGETDLIWSWEHRGPIAGCY